MFFKPRGVITEIENIQFAENKNRNTKNMKYYSENGIILSVTFPAGTKALLAPILFCHFAPQLFLQTDSKESFPRRSLMLLFLTISKPV